MIKIQKYFSCITLFLVVRGCSEFLEKSIFHSVVILEAPANHTTLNSYTVNFRWESVNNASLYELQLVSPIFDFIKYYLLDSTLETNRFNIALAPGSYSWPVRALNGSSNTQFSTHLFRINTASFIVQNVIQSGPYSGILINYPLITLSWQTLFGSLNYQVQIESSTAGPSISLMTHLTSISFIVPKEGLYNWKVRGENAKFNSLYSKLSSFFFDKTPPQRLSLTGPANGSKSLLPDTLRLKVISDAIKYKVYVFQSDFVSSFSTGYPVTVDTNSYLFSGGTQGQKIYWSLTALDQAGNESKQSTKNNFVVGS